MIFYPEYRECGWKQMKNIYQIKEGIIIMKNVVIIGAGPAGLTAAYELLQRAPKEYSITILEESNAIGGISKTVKYKNNRMDIGGHRFFSKDQQVMDWWQKMMPRQGKPSFDDIKLHREKKLAAGGPDPEKTDRVMLVRNRVSRIYYKHKFFDYPVSLKWDTIKNMGFATTVAAGRSEEHHRQKGRILSGKLLYQSFRQKAVFHVLRGLHRKAVGSPSERNLRRLGLAACQGLVHHCGYQGHVLQAESE